MHVFTLMTGSVYNSSVGDADKTLLLSAPLPRQTN